MKYDGIGESKCQLQKRRTINANYLKRTIKSRDKRGSFRSSCRRPQRSCGRDAAPFAEDACCLAMSTRQYCSGSGAMISSQKTASWQENNISNSPIIIRDSNRVEGEGFVEMSRSFFKAHAIASDTSKPKMRCMNLEQDKQIKSRQTVDIAWMFLHQRGKNRSRLIESLFSL